MVLPICSHVCKVLVSYAPIGRCLVGDRGQAVQGDEAIVGLDNAGESCH